MLNPIFYDGVTGAAVSKYEFPLGFYLGIKYSGLNDPLDTVLLTITFDDPTISPITYVSGIDEFNFFRNPQGWMLIPLPNKVTKGEVKLWVQTPFGNEGPYIYNIGIGTPPDVSPGPPEDKNLLNDIKTVVKYVAIGAGVIAIIYLASAVAPSVSKNIVRTRR